MQIIFNGKKSYDDFGLVVESFNIQPPSKKKIKQSVPFMNGSYDFSAVGSNGEIVYNERTIQVNFWFTEVDRNSLYNKYSRVLEWLLGAGQAELIFTDMPDTYFLAEVEEAPEFEEVVAQLGRLQITFVAEPFKYGVDYEGYKLWDTFNFEIDYLQDTEFDVVGSKVITLYNPGRPVAPLINTNAPMTAALNGKDMQQNIDFMQGTLNNLVVVNNKLQLPNVGNPTFTRSSVAYLSDGTQVAANQPRFEQGRFGKAIIVEEGTTNLLQNPSFETSNFSSWNQVTTYGGATYEVTSEKTWHGSYSVKITVDGTASESVGISQSRISATAGVTYTFSVKLAGTLGANKVHLMLRWMTADNTIIKNDNFYISEAMPQTFKTYSATATAPENTARMEVHVRIVRDAVGVLYVDAAQLEAKPYATSFIDGTRAAETLTIPTTGVLNPQEGTVECWVYVNGVVRRNIANNQPTVVLIRKGSSTANWIWLNHRPAGTWGLQIRKDGTTTGSRSFSDSLTPDGWHYFAIRWNAQAGTADLFHNGVKRVSLTGVVFPAEYDRIEIGHRSGSSGDWFNSLIDDLRISSIARSDEEIAAAYQSGQPLPVDEWTTYLLRFNDSLSFGQGGSYISPEYDLTTVVKADSSTISWQEDADGIQRSVYAKLDNQGDWVQVQNGASLPIHDVDTLIGRKLQIKTKLLRVV